MLQTLLPEASQTLDSKEAFASARILQRPSTHMGTKTMSTKATSSARYHWETKVLHNNKTNGAKQCFEDCGIQSWEVKTNRSQDSSTVLDNQGASSFATQSSTE